MTDFVAWLNEIGLGRHAEALRVSEVDFDMLRTLTEADLKELGLSLGDRRRLLQGIAAHAEAAFAVPSRAPLLNIAGPAVERRQLTVMFADLADSMALSRALDPEELREVMSGYQAAVTTAIRGTGGFDLPRFFGPRLA